MPLMARSIATTTVALLIAISVLLLPAAAEYPMFHNDPQRTGNVSGYAPVTGNLLWKTQPSSTGCGYIGGGASIVDGRIYVSNWPSYPVGGDLGFFCLNETDGTVLWSNPIGGFGGVSTPAVSGDRVFVGSYTGDLYCVNASDGTTVWNRTIEPDPGCYGVASSPLIHTAWSMQSALRMDGYMHSISMEPSSGITQHQAVLIIICRLQRMVANYSLGAETL